LLLRAVSSFLVLPGIVAFVVPFLLRPVPHERAPFDPLGLIAGIPGLALLVWTTVAFSRYGRGTIAPWDPPRALVTHGAYRVSRNPMYIAVLLVLAGWALAFHSPALAVYACCVGIAFHIRILVHEEPSLERLFKNEWVVYRSRTPRWL
jgi:protein-S-isoprenylcysteine O-methyltransferase Ste14